MTQTVSRESVIFNTVFIEISSHFVFYGRLQAVIKC